MDIMEQAFLNELKEIQSSVTIFLLNGTKLQGILVDYDNDTLFLRREGHTQMIYKQSVSTVMPSMSVHFERKSVETVKNTQNIS